MAKDKFFKRLMATPIESKARDYESGAARTLVVTGQARFYRVKVSYDGMWCVDLMKRGDVTPDQ